MDLTVSDEATLKQFVRELRRSRGMPQEALARASGYGRKTVSEFENSGSSLLSTALGILTSLGCELIVRVPDRPGSTSDVVCDQDDEIVFDGPVA